MLQVAEIQDMAASLHPGKIRIELPHQPHNALGRPGGGPQLRQHLAGIAGKAHGAAFQPFLTGFSDNLHLLRQLRVIRLAGKAQVSKIDILPDMHLIPGGAAAQQLQLLYNGGNNGNGLFHSTIPAQPLQADGERRNLHIQPGEQVLHQIPAPDGIRRIGDSLQLHVVQAVLQPLLGIQVAAGGVVNLLHNLRDGTVVSAHPLGIQELQEVVFQSVVFIGPLQQILHQCRPNFGALRLLRHPEIPGQIHPVGIFLENRSAKAVHRGNLGKKQPLKLALQMGVLRLLGNALGELGRNLAAKLQGSRLGIGDDKEFIQVGRVFFIRQIVQQTVHQDLGLAGPGGGADQQLAAPIMNGQLLVRGQLLSHVASTPFLSAPRIPGHLFSCNSAVR